MTLRIAIAGAAGRMGKALIEATHAASFASLTVATVRPGSSLTGADAGELASVGKLNVFLVNDLAAVIDQFDVLIDFSSTSATLANLALCAEHGKPVVIGTTGFNEQEKADVLAWQSRIPLCLSANYSTGVNLCFKLLDIAARVMAEDADAKGLAQVSMNENIPVTFGVLTVDSIEQAIERSGTKAGNKGVEAASTALEMVSLLGHI